MRRRQSLALGVGLILVLLLNGCSGPEGGPVAAGSGSLLTLPSDGRWVSLFTGESLEGWEVVAFGGEGPVEVQEGSVILSRGEPFTGIRWTSAVPTMNYEIELEARRLAGFDFFCGLTVPVRDAHCSLIVGGWGGGLVGLSSLDGRDASENETATYRRFENDRWYRIRLRVLEHRILAWLDDEEMVDASTVDRQVGLRPGPIGLCRPLGVCSWQTTAAVRNVRIRLVEAATP